MSDLPRNVRVVIVGGGIIGCSTAYHLAKEGWTDIVLVERAKLTSGSTFHAAGLVGQLRSNANVTQLLKYSVELYARLEQETGLATGWKMNGGLRLACNRQRMTEIKRQATTAHSFGLEMELLTPSQARDLWPAMAVSDLVGAAFLPTDGQANPSDITQALAKGARNRGVRIVEDCAVTGFSLANGRVADVSTSLGDITCEVVVNCAGQWAREVGLMAGVVVPLVSVQHQYMITDVIQGLPSNLPTLRDPDRFTYFKEEVGGLVMGGYERNPIPWAEAGIPPGFHFSLLESNWTHFEPMMEQALARVPLLETAGVKELINGPESFTPDGNFILGEAPNLPGFFVGAGFNAFGIASGGGAGKALAEWVAGGEPAMDLWPVDLRRFGAHHADTDWVRGRTLELYGKHYTMSWPFEEHGSGRPVRTSALYPKLKEQGACFGEKMAWERPNWFAPPGVAAKDEYSFGRQNWFPHVGEEHKNTRQSVCLFDQSSFAKFLVKGRDAERALSWICANNVARPPGTVVYTQMLNQRGGIECDLTVSRLTDQAFYIVAGTGFRTHDYHWMRRNLAAGLDVEITDVTDDHCTLSLMGPNSREVLGRVTSAGLSNEEFPFASCRIIEIGGARVTALRLTYVGELGWELHFPIQHALEVYEAIMAAGKPFGIRNAGYRAIESLRLEKGYLAWGADIGPDYTPLEAGLGFALKLRTEQPFLGRESLLEARAKPLQKRLACFTVADPESVLLGRETIYRDGQRVGWLSSAGYGFTVERNIGYGYVRHAEGVDRAFLQHGVYELEVAAERLPCEIHFGSLYDPGMKKIKI